MASPDPTDTTLLGPVRDWSVRVGGALIATLLLKWFCLEASRIPSPSMHPTLLGADEAGVHDGVLVDKLHYLVSAPRRWDLVTFHPPLQSRETFVKRLIGLPGEQIVIAGGNVHSVVSTNPPQIVVLRRPEALLAGQWRDVHPGRAIARGEPASLAASFDCEPNAAWQRQPDCLVARLAPGRPARLQWLDPDGGLVDRIWDGLPADVARAVRAVHAPRSELAEVVGDARLQVHIVAARAPARVGLVIEVRRPGHATLHFGCDRTTDGITLFVRREDEIVATRRAPAPAWPDEGGVTLAFAHVDDETVAWCDGAEVARLDTSAFDLRAGCELPDPCGMGPAMPLPDHRADVSITLEGEGEATIDDIRIWRDQHWTRGSLPASGVVEVPADRYFVLGDNPLQSGDGRGTRTFTIGALHGAAVPPDTPGCVVRVGNLHVGDPELPHRDENPVVLGDRHELLVTDRFGNVDRLRGDVRSEPDGSGLTLLLPQPDGTLREHALVSTSPQFLARSDLLGRAIFRYWPVPPFGPWRAAWLH